MEYEELEQRITLVEDLIRNQSRTLTNFFQLGRLRTDRTAPSSSADVQEPDELYDRVLTPTNEYILINNSGTLEWKSVTLSTF